MKNHETGHLIVENGTFDPKTGHLDDGTKRDNCGTFGPMPTNADARRKTLRVKGLFLSRPARNGTRDTFKTGHWMMGQDMSALRAATSHPTAAAGRSERTDIVKSVLEIAKRVLENVDAGRVYPSGTVEWAKQIVAGNRPKKPPQHGRTGQPE